MEATGIAAEIGAKRRLQRKARPRSGSPKTIVRTTAPVYIIGTSGITSGSVFVGNGCRVSITTAAVAIGTDVRINVGVGGGAAAREGERRARG